MMQRACAVLVAALVAVSPAVFAAEKLTEVDGSGGKSTGQWVMFLSKGQAANAPTGTCAVVLGNGENIEAAYGMNVQGGKPVVSVIPADVIKAERASDKAPDATTLIVKVSPEQHDAVKQIIDKWAAIKEHVDPVMDVAINFVQEPVDALGMKRAYRSGLGGLHPVNYYADLSVVNRKLGQKKDS